MTQNRKGGLRAFMQQTATTTSTNTSRKHCLGFLVGRPCAPEAYVTQHTGMGRETSPPTQPGPWVLRAEMRSQSFQCASEIVLFSDDLGHLQRNTGRHLGCLGELGSKSPRRPKSDSGGWEGGVILQGPNTMVTEPFCCS